MCECERRAQIKENFEYIAKISLARLTSSEYEYIRFEFLTYNDNLDWRKYNPGYGQINLIKSFTDQIVEALNVDTIYFKQHAPGLARIQVRLKWTETAYYFKTYLQNLEVPTSCDYKTIKSFKTEQLSYDDTVKVLATLLRNGLIAETLHN